MSAGNSTSTRDVVARDRRRLSELFAERDRIAQDIAALDQTVELITSGRELLAGDLAAFDRAIDAVQR
jgi:hypothetical protein